MKVNQIYSLLNDINHQMFGADALQVKDLSGIISMGKALQINSSTTDKFLGKLVDRIGKTVIRTLDLELDYPNLYMDSYSFGCVLQKVTVNPFDSITSSEYNVGANDFTPTLLNVAKPDKIFVTYFHDIDTFKFKVTIAEDLLWSAFTSEQMMSEFITAIINSLSDSVTISVNNMARTAVNNFIAEKILAGNGVVDLLAGYNTTFGLTGDDAIDADEAMHSKEFARFASTVIRKYIKYLGQPSELYNVGDGSGNGILRATSRDNMHVLMLSDLSALFDAYLISDSFKDVYGLPNYTEVAYWQGNHSASGDNIFSVNSAIDLVPSSQESVTTPENRYEINQTGIVCVLADRQAIAIGLNKYRSGAFRNDIDDYYTISQTVSTQYINDMSENGIIFTVGSAVTPGITVDKSTLTFANSSADSQTITATTIPADATVTWKSSKASVATVSSGVVSPAGSGSCNITAEITVGGTKYTATTAVTVG